MKLVLSVLSVLALSTVSAVAAPAVGDQAAFQGTWGGQAVYQHLSYVAFNSSTQQFTKRTTTKIGDAAPATQDDLVNFNDTASDAAMQYVVDNCGQYRGTNETITVPAGTYRTCKMPLDQGGFAWIGVVPFAVVRIETPVNGQTLTAWLTGFARGQ